MGVERAMVVERRKELTYLLCQAAELEHGLMCEYLYAAFSLRREPGPGLPADRMEMVERWRSVLLSIAREEMLHWATVLNLLAAVGSAPYVSRPHFPHQAQGYPAGVQLRLLPFSETALRHFVFLERPADAEVGDGDGFEPVGPALPEMSADDVVPRGQEFDTVGYLYRSIGSGLTNLAEKLGEDQLFIGPAFHQADESSFRWPDLNPITNLDGALQAVERIVVQGEGATGDWSRAHYGRFLGVLDEYLDVKQADDAFEPAHPCVAAAVRSVEGIEPDVYITDPTTSQRSDLFNAVYELLLQMIARYFAFGHETAEQREILAFTCISLMTRVLSPLGVQLARAPVGVAYPDATAGANFQLPYRTSFLLPHRRAAWIRFEERLRELAEYALAIPAASHVDGSGADAIAGVSDAMRAMASKLAAHIEPVG
jgi:hypothetical protein